MKLPQTSIRSWDRGPRRPSAWREPQLVPCRPACALCLPDTRAVRAARDASKRRLETGACEGGHLMVTLKGVHWRGPNRHPQRTLPERSAWTGRRSRRRRATAATCARPRHPFCPIGSHLPRRSSPAHAHAQETVGLDGQVVAALGERRRCVCRTPGTPSALDFESHRIWVGPGPHTRELLLPRGRGREGTVGTWAKRWGAAARPARVTTRDLRFANARTSRKGRATLKRSRASTSAAHSGRSPLRAIGPSGDREFRVRARARSRARSPGTPSARVGPLPRNVVGSVAAAPQCGDEP